ncbi:MAG: (Fe-S)-binding protein [Candidatus Odinarchaeota archaeon]
MTVSKQLTTSSKQLDQASLEIILACYQCGLCTSVCPKRKVSRYNPRRIIHSALIGQALADEDLTDCLTCGLCVEHCPQMVDFPDFIRARRATSTIEEENFAHHNIFNLSQKFMVDMAESGMKFDYEGEIDPQSSIAYFPGCIDLYDRFLDLTKVSFHQIGQSAINLMNKAGFKPNLLSLKCCGHDAYWTGDEDSFNKSREYNSRVIRESGISTLVVSCAECFYSFEKLYELEGVKIQHISQFIVEHQGALEFKEKKTVLTYHDPCRLGRYMKDYDSPRDVLQSIPSAKMVEMANNRENCNCCGVSAWLRCDDKARAIMLQKLDEATVTGANELIVACTKCFAHLNCVLEDKQAQHDYKIQVKELGSLADELTAKNKNS